MRRLATLLASLSLVAGGAALAVPAQAADELPVDYNFLVGAIAAGLSPQPDAPGVNDWDCKPTAGHPRPVILVHGTFGNRSTNWQAYGPLLKNNGYCVFALNYGLLPGMPDDQRALGGLTRIQDSAADFAAFAAKVRRATGARKIDLIGHSQGTLMPNYYVKFLGGAKYVKRYVSLAPLWHGTEAVAPIGELRKVFPIPEQDVPVCAACGQMSADSAFMKKMRIGPVAVEGVEYTNIMTKYDQLVRPYTSGRQRGMRNIVIQDRCGRDRAEHFEIAADPVAAAVVLNTLDPGHPQPVPCLLVLPYVGPVLEASG